MTSLASANGPSTIEISLPVLLMRTPFSPYWMPSVAMSQPAFMPSAIKAPIVAIISGVGPVGTGAWVKMLRYLMFDLLSDRATNEGPQDRQAWSFFSGRRSDIRLGRRAVPAPESRDVAPRERGRP